MSLLLLVTVYLVISTSLATDCPPGEYKNNDLCCPMCHIGTVVKSHCTSTSSSNVCIPCVKGTYMDHPNGVNKCLKCTDCDTGGGLLEIKECTYTSNAVCDCKPGYYCSGQKDSCDLCQPHRICNVGQYIKVQGTSKTDNVCEDCPPGYFSTENMSKTCTAWTACTEQGRQKSSQGTSTSDSVCVDGRSHYMVIIPIASILLIFWFICLQNRIKERAPERNNVHEQQDEPRGVFYAYRLLLVGVSRSNLNNLGGNIRQSIEQPDDVTQ
ncbi:tumor necrosis factor receptor superfamily member 14 isoform X2 [Rana temporaria]|uniref:tumor necrosis factor receptor superfamily member 14 isoform X2 n=1 Tax=Rana temporaria TaxID=8407 RepID=UPI001AAE14EC|nr:tumor necrosis factor receptor superfamily member 14 isoform X2 [Rana temporaria]